MLDTLIQEAVEKYGTEITRAEVRLNEVEIDLGSGMGALRGLSVGNPSGFKTPTSIKLGLISVAVDTSTLTSDPVVIKEIVIGDGAVSEDFGYILNLMRHYGSIDYSMGVAHRYVNRAKSLLSCFEDSPHKKALEVIADYVVTRDH